MLLSFFYPNYCQIEELSLKYCNVASSPLNSSVVLAVTRLFSRWFQSMAVLMNREFLYCSVLGCLTTTARVLFLTFEFTMFMVSQSWNVPWAS
jgi:hypothetical protein